jgi:flavin-dependent dehydrogenase
MSTRSFDVVIVGAGPAGSVAARELARRGASVLLLGRNPAKLERIGETAPPDLGLVLNLIGLGDILASGAHQRSPAVVSTWGDSQPTERNHILSPYGEGWHLDRSVFDSQLVAAAQREGAEVCDATRIVVTADREGFLLRLQGGSNRARRLILATGRSCRGLGLPARRQWIDALVAVAGFIDVGAVKPDPRTMIEAFADGWLYSALLPDGRCVVVALTDGDLLPSDMVTRTTWWRKAVQGSNLVGLRALDQARAVALATYDARSSFLIPLGGVGWQPIGDARLALDPLAGRGIPQAISDGIWAAEACLQSVMPSARDLVGSRTRAELSGYLETRQWVYAQERRWMDRPFWRRRHALVAGY